MAWIKVPPEVLISTHGGSVRQASRSTEDMNADPTTWGPRRSLANAAGAMSRICCVSTVSGHVARHRAST